MYVYDVSGMFLVEDKTGNVRTTYVASRCKLTDRYHAVNVRSLSPATVYTHTPISPKKITRMRLTSTVSATTTRAVAAAVAAAAAVIYCLSTAVVTYVDGATAVCEVICDVPLPLGGSSGSDVPPSPYTCAQAIEDYDIWGDCCSLKEGGINGTQTGCNFITTTSCNIQTKGADGCVEYDADGNCIAAVIPYTEYSAGIDYLFECPESDIEIPPYPPTAVGDDGNGTSNMTESPGLENSTTSTPTPTPTTEAPAPSPSAASTTRTIIPGFTGTATTSAATSFLLLLTCML